MPRWQPRRCLDSKTRDLEGGERGTRLILNMNKIDLHTVLDIVFDYISGDFGKPFRGVFPCHLDAASARSDRVFPCAPELANFALSCRPFALWSTFAFSHGGLD